MADMRRSMLLRLAGSDYLAVLTLACGGTGGEGGRAAHAQQQRRYPGTSAPLCARLPVTVCAGWQEDISLEEWKEYCDNPKAAKFLALAMRYFCGVWRNYVAMGCVVLAEGGVLRDVRYSRIA
eukprot:2559342-Rhodomonas_salina.4